MQEIAEEGCIFVIEHCANCRNHFTEEVHFEEKFQNFFEKMRAALEKKIPGCVVLANCIPKSWVNYDLYNSLMHNDDINNDNF